MHSSRAAATSVARGKKLGDHYEISSGFVGCSGLRSVRTRPIEAGYLLNMLIAAVQRLALLSNVDEIL